jgi:hypothetical protein
MKKERLILVIFAMFALNSCNQKSKINASPLTVDTKVKGVTGESFDEFSKLFYSDSLFQINRIIFPLESDIGNSHSNDSEDSTIHVWKKENWVMLKNNFFKDSDSICSINGEIYKRRIRRTNILVIESIYIEDSGFITTMKFSLRNGKWYLSDYTESDN